MTFDEPKTRAALWQSWSLETAKQWTAEAPYSGQCNVTAVVAQELFGGDILKTQLPEVMHFYNRIDGVVVDLTDEQFDKPIPYDDAISNREEAMECVLDSEYEILLDALSQNLKEKLG
ncbi:MAG: hypothetical protein NXI13_05215 [Proteobacteria bacterium]|nr:hypothetical protein [Pseudomonadota bacterium]